VISQIHGANRLGGNSLLDTMVFGKIAGGEAAKMTKKATKASTKNTEAQAQLKSIVTNQEEVFDDYDVGIFVVDKPLRFLKEIQELMKQNAGIVRERTRLENGLKRILELRNEFYSNRASIDIREFKNDDNNSFENIILTWQVKSSLIACEAIIRGGLLRKESRGAHYRSDFPNLDKRWKVNIYCRKRSNGSTVAAEEEMILFKHGIREIKGPLAGYLRSHVKAAHHRTFE
jgi:succinate dehydrogenase/fumarate reductase flavoprotein subunit